MQMSSASTRKSRMVLREDGLTLTVNDTARDPQGTFAVDHVGYLVPIADFDGAVHSVFERACNFACGDSLLTLVTHERADGPTTLRLEPGAVADLRLMLRPGDGLRCRDGVVSAVGVKIRLAGAAIWRPAPPRATVPMRQLGANLRYAAAALQRRRRTHSSVIDREGGGALAGLVLACRNLDVGPMVVQVEQLIGWGEGLTPAGDDVLIGLYAALDVLADGRADRTMFLRGLSGAIAARTSRTTPIAAHCLRLAAGGHFSADVTGLRHALVGERDRAVVAAALDCALDAGATSGADMVTGLLRGFAAWSRAGADGECELLSA